MRNKALAALGGSPTGHQGLLALLFLFGLHSTFLWGQSIELQARSIPRGDLPVGFPEPVLDAGFAIIEVTVGNSGEAPVQVAPDLVQAWSPRKKKLAQVPSTKILPKLVKFYRGGGAGVGGQVDAGGLATSRPSPPAGSPKAGDSSYSVIITQQLRVVLDGYRLKQGTLEPGESIQGFIYVKSKHRGRKLAGGKVTLGDATAVIE